MAKSTIWGPSRRPWWEKLGYPSQEAFEAAQRPPEAPVEAPEEEPEVSPKDSGLSFEEYTRKMTEKKFKELGIPLDRLKR